MFEMIGLVIGLFVLCCLCTMLGLLIAALAWLLFWKRRRPKRLIFIAASVPLLSLGYVIACAILFAIVVPNQPDQIFGDISEPLPNGYVLTAIGKMADYAYIDTKDPWKTQPKLLGGIHSLEVDDQVVFGAYSHPEVGFPDLIAPPDVGYFVFDTRTGQIRNLKSMQELVAAAGHPAHLVDTPSFRSQDPGRVRLRKTEDWIYFFPPFSALLLCFYRLIRFRIKGEKDTQTQAGLLTCSIRHLAWWQRRDSSDS